VRRAARRLAAVSLLATACIDLSTDPDEIVAIELRAPAWPSVVAGDTLRDALGVAAPLEALLFDGSGDVVTGAPVDFFPRDTVVTVSPTGIVVARDSVDGVAELIASTPGVQSTVRRLEVVPRPDSLAAQGTIDTLRWVIPDQPSANTSAELRVRLLNRTETDVQGVRAWVVHWSLEFNGQPVPPGDSTLIFLVAGSGALAVADTTDAQGNAGIRVRLRAGPGLNPVDSAVVTAEARYHGVPVAGSGLRLVLPLRPAGASSAVAGADRRLQSRTRPSDGGRDVRSR
jgi:hypothetical protein